MDEHRHQWSVVDFYLDADRPMMQQACACGAERAIRAWDRFWEPQAANGALSPDSERQGTSELMPCLI